MLSVRKSILLTTGLSGIFCALFGSLDFFVQRDIMSLIFFGIFVVVAIFNLIYLSKKRREPWDELTRENIAKAEHFTLLFTEILLLLVGIIIILGRFTFAAKASHILILYGVIQIIYTAAFLFYDSPSAAQGDET